MKTTTYDKTEIFEEKVLPHIKEAMKECSLHQIPAFVSFATKNSEDGTEYYSDMVSPISEEIYLKEERITGMADVLNGFDVVEKDKIIEIEM